MQTFHPVRETETVASPRRRRSHNVNVDIGNPSFGAAMNIFKIIVFELVDSDAPESDPAVASEASDPAETLPRGLYAVESIQTHRRRDDGDVEYFVKWLGYPVSENSWEPEACFIGSSALALLRSYQEMHNLNIIPQLLVPPARRSGEVIFKELLEAGMFPNGDPLDIDSIIAYPPGTKRVNASPQGIFCEHCYSFFQRNCLRSAIAMGAKILYTSQVLISFP